jgi:hypothetical protein
MTVMQSQNTLPETASGAQVSIAQLKPTSMAESASGSGSRKVCVNNFRVASWWCDAAFHGVDQQQQQHVR